MKHIKLTEEQQSKLLEMCKVLFPEYDEIELEIEPQYDGSDGFVQLTLDKNKNLDFINIHWFEFCMTHLVTKLRSYNYVQEQTPKQLMAFYNLETK